MSVEGTISYGARFTPLPPRALRTTELEIGEVCSPRGDAQAGRGKSDDINALAAARTVLSEDTHTLLEPLVQGTREGLRILLNARGAMDRQAPPPP